MTLTRHIYAIAGLVTILTAVSLSSTRAKVAGPPVQNVNVVNTPNVNVSTLPAVQIAANQSVGISNTASNPLPVDTEASHSPIRISAIVPVADGAWGNAIDVYDIPAGYELFIQSAFGYATLPVGQKVVGAYVSGIPVPFVDRGASNNQEFGDGSVTQAAFSLPPGASVNFFVNRSDTAGSPSITMEFTGYLVPVSQINTSSVRQTP